MITTGDAYLLREKAADALSDYTAEGGGEGLEIARRLGAGGVIDEIEASGLRGRGGGGFTTGAKWRSVASGGPEAGDRYVVVNGAEGEPGTFKDRAMLRANPYAVLEGAAIAASAVGARAVYVAVKASFEREVARLRQAITETDRAGWFGDLPVVLVEGPEEYLFGEEKALLEVVEGEDPLPRIFPPYLYGLFSTAPQMGWSAGSGESAAGPAMRASNPTLVNNVETLANVPHILRDGADWYRSMGTPESPGHVIVTVTGDTERAAVAEVELGRPLGEVLDEVGGGMPAGRHIKAVLSGVANPVITPEMLEAPLSYEGLAGAGSAMGAAGFIVFDDTRNMAEVAYWASAFLYVESCGQCPACKFGTGEVTAYLHRLLSGRGDASDLDAIAARLATVDDGSRCALPLEERALISSILTAYPDDVAAAASGHASLAQRPLVNKVVDISDGQAVLDREQHRKRPDWTYAESPVVISRA